MSDVILSVPVDAGGVDPLLASLEKIRENLEQINQTSAGSFDLMSKSLDKSNKKLKETDKTFGEIFKKIKLSGLMKLGAGVIGAGAGLLGISTGAMLFGALKNSAGIVATGYQGAGLGMTSAEMKALQVASKLTTGKEDTLVTALTSLTNALNTAEGASALAAIGLNQEDLKTKKPEDALEAVFNAVKGKGTGIGFEFLRDAFSKVTGLSGQDYNVATKQGAAFEAPFNEFLVKYSGVNFDELGQGAQGLIKFQAQLDIVSAKLGSALGGPLDSLLTKLSPHIDALADRLAAFLNSISQEDVDNFAAAVGKLFDFIGGVAKAIDENSKPGAAESYYDARNEAFKSGDIGGAFKADIQGFGAQTLEGIRKNLAFVFNPEERTKQILGTKEPFLRETLATQGKQLTQSQFTDLEALGYIKNGQLTQKARDMNITITVKDPSGKVLTTAVATQGSPSSSNPLRGGR